MRFAAFEFRVARADAMLKKSVRQRHGGDRARDRKLKKSLSNEIETLFCYRLQDAFQRGLGDVEWYFSRLAFACLT